MDAALVNGDTSNSATKGTDSRRRKPFATLVIFDAEATDLQSKHTRFTELCMFGVQTGELLSHCAPRTINKLQLCINPQCSIPPGVSRLTGLYNDTLEPMTCFKEQVQLICKFLSILPKPVCLIAHNGKGFDFPLLQAELKKADYVFEDDSEIFCADSLEAFRVMDGLPPQRSWGAQRDSEVERLKNSIAASVASVFSSAEHAGENDSDDQPDSSTKPDITSNNGTHSPCKTKDGSEFGQRCVEPWADKNFGNNINKRSLESHDAEPSKAARIEDGGMQPSKTGGVENALQPFNTCKAQDGSQSPKSAKVEDGFDSQCSITDTQLMAACDDVLSPLPVTDVAMTHNAATLQAMQETTPTKNTEALSESALQPVKRDPFTPVDSTERERITRRLFEDKEKDLPGENTANKETALPGTSGSKVVSSLEDIASKGKVVPGTSGNIVFTSLSQPRMSAVDYSLPKTVSRQSSDSADSNYRDFACSFSSLLLPTSMYSSGNLPPTSIYSSGNPPTSMYSSANPPTSSYSSGNPPTSMYSSGNTPTSMYSSGNTPTSIYSSGNTPTSIYSSGNLQPTSYSYSGNTPTKFAVMTSMPNSMKNSMPRVNLLDPSPSAAGLTHSRTAAMMTVAAPAQNSAQRSYRLGEVYKREFGQYPTVVHTAEDDCVTLLKIIERKAGRFLPYVEAHAVPFSSVKPMW